MVLIIKHSDPYLIVRVQAMINDFGAARRLNKTFVAFVAKCAGLGMSLAAKLVWPVVHIARKYRYRVSSVYSI